MDSTAEGSSASAIYLLKAREMRRQAEQLHDPSARHQLAMLALAYELLADHLLAGIGNMDDETLSTSTESGG
jgi:hypothetical protein